MIFSPREEQDGIFSTVTMLYSWSAYARILPILLLLRATISSGRLMRIALATDIISVPESNTTNFDALQMQGAAIDLGVKYIQKTYGKIFNFTHTYLMDPKRPTVPMLIDDIENFVAKFYYQRFGEVEGVALLSPCKLSHMSCVPINYINMCVNNPSFTLNIPSVYYSYERSTVHS